MKKIPFPFLLVVFLTFFFSPSCFSQLFLYQHEDAEAKQLTMLATDIDRDSVFAAQQKGAKILVFHEQEKKFLADPQGVFWNDYIVKKRYNESSCQPTNVPFAPYPNEVLSGDVDTDYDFVGSKVRVLSTPGVRKNSVSLILTDQDGQLNVHTGHLIFGDGKIAHLFDLQDNFPEAKIGPYHGFMARAPHLIASLEKIRALKPATLVPANGKVIDNPDETIENLIQRLRAVYRNYLSTSALWWYFGEERMNASGKAIIGDEYDPEKLERMPQAKTFDNPDWLTGFGTTRLIRSETGNVFVLDVGSKSAADRIIEMHKKDEFKKVTGIHVTHYHHDHNPGVPAVAEYFSAPVYGVEPLADILERPGAYRMPCLENVEFSVIRKKHGEKMRWHEFELTFFDYPGQTLYHNALLVRRGEERPILFVGDSFTPTGIDDYCAFNRNLLKEGKGYLQCLDIIRSIEPTPMIVNQHVEPPFEFDSERLDYMEHALRERMKLLADLLTVPEINFGLDHAWCRFDPFVASYGNGETKKLKMVITNHFDKTSKFRIQLHGRSRLPFALTPEAGYHELTIEGGEEKTFEWTIYPSQARVTPQTVFLYAKVFGEEELVGECEAIIVVESLW